MALFSLAQGLAAETNAPTCRLTVELRDGSRVVGAGVEPYFQFHSALLGKLKLAVKDLRAVECVSSNLAKLTTTGGDTLTVEFADASFPLQTSFGKIKVQVDSLRKLTVSTVSASGAHPPGLVALWSGEDSGKDSVGHHDAELTDIAFVEGKVGRAFEFEGANATIKIPGNAALDTKLNNGFTLMAWINPTDVSKYNPIFEWVEAGISCGTQFYIYPPSGGLGTLYALIGDTEGHAHYFNSFPEAVASGTFQHVALTYDKASGIGKIFCNGVMVAQQHLGQFTPQTSCNLYLGKRPLISGETFQFNGFLDEASIYERALSAAEIQAICTTHNHGESLPSSLVQPARNFPLR